MRVITLEEHFATPLFLDGPGQDLKKAALKFEGRAMKLIEPLCDIGDKRLAAMDAAGIDFQMLSLTSPGSCPKVLSRALKCVSCAIPTRHHNENSEIFELSRPSTRVKHNRFIRLAFGGPVAFPLIGRAKHMTLRIQRSDEDSRVVLTLIGRIQGDQVPELEALLRSGTDHNVVDLKEIKLADRDAVRFLAQSEAEGTKLRNCPTFIREWISQERNELQREEAEQQQL